MRSFYHYRHGLSAAIHHAMLTAPLLVAYGSGAVAASTNESTQADPTPIVVMYQTAENNSELSCSFELKNVFGRPVDVFPKHVCEKVDEEAFKPQSIRIRNVPIKTRFLLSDNDRCDKSSGRWLELDTSRANASLEKLGVDKLWSYAGSAEKPGYVNNTGLDSNAPSYGFRVVGKGDPIGSGKLTCLVATFAPGSN